MRQVPKSFFLELAGLPASGKTTTAYLLLDELIKRGLHCFVIPEAAARSPLLYLKRKWQFNAWTLCQAVTSILEHEARPAHDLVVLDRGLVDALCWIRWYRLTGVIEGAIADVLESFVRVQTWFQKLGLVVVLRVKFETALQRRGLTGRILNPNTYQELHEAYDFVINNLKTDRHLKHIYILDTDELSPPDVLDWMLERLNDRWPQLKAGTRRC